MDHSYDDTIFSLATAVGRSATAMIRISGSRVRDLSSVFNFASLKFPRIYPSNSLEFVAGISAFWEQIEAVKAFVTGFCHHGCLFFITPLDGRDLPSSIPLLFLLDL